VNEVRAIEYRCVRSDAEGQRQQRDRAEHRRAPQPAEDVFQTIREFSHDTVLRAATREVSRLFPAGLAGLSGLKMRPQQTAPGSDRLSVAGSAMDSA